MSLGWSLAAALLAALLADETGAPRVPLEATLGSELRGPSADEVAAHAALEAGLAWLAARQGQELDGSWPLGEAAHPAPVAVTALASLAFMAAGHSPGRGAHGEALTRALDYLLQRTDLVAGSPTLGYVRSSADATSRMHGHGYATLAMAQAYGMTPPRSDLRTRLHEALPAAVALIERTQGLEGGWWYDAERSSSHEGSVTICLVQALRAARNAGIHVDPQVIARAESYVERSQAADGTFRYMLGSERTSLALTAAAVTTLNAAGRYGGPVLDSATDALWRGLFDRDQGLGAPSEYPYYERLYLAQAFWQHLDESHFERWFPLERERVLRARTPEGHWKDPRYGDAYATAVNALFLAMPEGLLPIFQR